ncbi:MAG: alpha/beta hydrolase [Bacillota bacterium]
MKKIISTVLLLIAAFGFSSCELDSYLFNPEKLNEYRLPGNNIPDSLLKQVTFNSEGNTLYGYWIASNGKRPGITMLYYHGNKHNIDEYWDRVMLLHQLGINVFIFDFRGFGKSQGESSTESALYADSRAALDFLKTRKDFNADSLCIYGYSLGNVGSVYITAEIFKPLCLFAESPFASANSLTQGSLVLDIPSKWLTAAEFDNVKEIKKISTPLMLFHGASDDFVRYRDNGRLVYEAAPEPKELVLVDNAVHTDVPYKMGTDNYLNKLRSWIDFSIKNRK